jgi:hypothetical protein
MVIHFVDYLTSTARTLYVLESRLESMSIFATVESGRDPTNLLTRLSLLSLAICLSM